MREATCYEPETACACGQRTGNADLWCYIAGPYTGDDGGASVIQHTRAAVDAAEAVRALGLVPLPPHSLTLPWELVYPHEYAWWIDLTCAWLKRCDVLLRLPGTSKGSDIEESKAREMGIPIVRSLGALDAWATKRRFDARKEAG